MINRSVSFRSLGRWEEAAIELEKVPTPGFRALELLGHARLKVAETGGSHAARSARRAREAYSLAVQKKPDCAECWAGLALAHLLLREREQALTAIRRAMMLEPENDSYRKLETRLLDRP